MLAPQAIQEGFAAATNAVTAGGATARREINPIGSFTDPEYAQVGLSEAAARAAHDVQVGRPTRFELRRNPGDRGRPHWRLLQADRGSRGPHRILGCHLVGDRAVDTVAQIAAVAMAGGLIRRRASARAAAGTFPTYAGVLARARRRRRAYFSLNAKARQATRRRP